MAWSIVGLSTVVEVTTTGHTLTLPAGVAAGDLLVAIVASRKASTTSGTLPAGWTRVTDQNNNNVVAGASTGIGSIDMFYVIHSGTTPALGYTHPVAPSVARACVVAYRGGDQTTPKDTQTSATTATAITAVSVTGLTTTAAEDLLVFGVAGGRAAAWSAFDAATDPGTVSGATDTTTAPTAGTWRERSDTTTTTGADTSLGIADAIRATAGATGNFTCTASLSGGHAVAVGAFKIATAAPTTITQTGSAVNFNTASTANAGTLTTTLTVPSDAELAVVGFASYPQDGAAGLYSGGSVTLTKGGVDTAMTMLAPGGAQEAGTSFCAPLWYMVLPDTGTNKTIKWDWAGTRTLATSGCVASVTFWKGIDTASPVRGSAGASAGGAPIATASITVNAGDLVLGWVGAFTTAASEGSATTGTNVVILSQVPFSNRADACWFWNNAPSGNQTVGMSAESGWDDLSITGVSFKPSTGVTGTLGELEDIDVSAFTGNVNWQTALATTEAIDVTAFNGTVRWAATMAETEDPDIPAFNGTVQWNATLATTEAADTPAITGDLGPAPTTGTLGAPEPPDVGAFTGTVTWVATLATTEAADTAAFNGLVFTPVTGTLGAPEPIDVSAFNGTVRWLATLATTEAPDTPAFNGTVRDPISAALTTTETPDVAAFNGTVGAVAVTGTLATTEAADTPAFTGGIFGTGTLAAAELPDTAALTGTVRWQASLASGEAPDVAAFTGNVVALTTVPGYSQAVLVV